MEFDADEETHLRSEFCQLQIPIMLVAAQHISHRSSALQSGVQ